MHGFIKHANDAQQVFLSSSTPTLQNALPALEKTHTAWEKVSNKPHYECFTAALDVGMMKLDKYYQCSAVSDAHIMAMGKIFFHYHLIVLTHCSP